MKLPVVFDGVFDTVIDKYLTEILPHYVYLELKANRGVFNSRVVDAIVGAHAVHDTAIADSTSLLLLFKKELPLAPPILHPLLLQSAT